MIETEEHLILLLQLISHNGDTQPLIDMGYEYSDLAKVLTQLRKDKYLDFESGTHVLTQDGVKLLDSLNNSLKRSGISRFVSPLLKFKRPKMNIYDIYLPVIKNKS